MTIEEILALPSGTKVEPVTVTLQFVNARKGPGKPQQIKVTDVTGSMRMVLWKRPDVYPDQQGTQQVIIGATVKDNEYNGNITKELHLNTDGSFATPGSVSPEQPTASPAPARTVAEFKKDVATAVNGHSHSNGNGYNSNGARAGMCVRAALDVIIAGYKKGEYDLEFFGTHEFGVTLKRIASDVCRVSEEMEAHKLSPSARDREELLVSKDKVIEADEELFAQEGQP